MRRLLTNIFNQCKQLREFSKAFFYQTNLNSFEHTRITNRENKIIILHTNTDWLENFLNKKYCRLAPEGYSNLIYFCSATKEFSIYDSQLLDMKINFNLDQGITLVEKHTKYLDTFTFTTNTNNHTIINYYLNNLYELKTFTEKYIKKFNTTMEQLISKYSMPIPIITPLINNTTSNHTNKSYYLPTSTELRCLEFLAIGYTAKMIAKLLGTSHRTVEKHLENLKKN